MTAHVFTRPRSVWLDLKIMFLTVKCLIATENAF